MSGGHFNDSGYVYYKVDRFADELEEELNQTSPPFGAEVDAVLREKLALIRKVAKYMKDIDYLFAADFGEQSFLRAIQNEDTRI